MKGMDCGSIVARKPHRSPRLSKDGNGFSGEGAERSTGIAGHSRSRLAKTLHTYLLFTKCFVQIEYHIAKRSPSSEVGGCEFGVGFRFADCDELFGVFGFVGVAFL